MAQLNFDTYMQWQIRLGSLILYRKPGAQAEGYKVILTKSTVPIGTSDEVSRRVSMKASTPS